MTGQGALGKGDVETPRSTAHQIENRRDEVDAVKKGGKGRVRSRFLCGSCGGGCQKRRCPAPASCAHGKRRSIRKMEDSHPGSTRERRLGCKEEVGDGRKALMGGKSRGQKIPIGSRPKAKSHRNRKKKKRMRAGSSGTDKKRREVERNERYQATRNSTRSRESRRGTRGGKVRLETRIEVKREASRGRKKTVVWGVGRLVGLTPRKKETKEHGAIESHENKKCARESGRQVVTSTGLRWEHRAG